MAKRKRCGLCFCHRKIVANIPVTNENTPPGCFEVIPICRACELMASDPRVASTAAPVPTRGAEPQEPFSQTWSDAEQRMVPDQPQAASVSALDTFRAWLVKSLQSTSSNTWDDGYLTAIRNAMCEYDVMRLRVAALTPTPAGPWTRERLIGIIDAATLNRDGFPMLHLELRERIADALAATLPAAPERTPR